MYKVSALLGFTRAELVSTEIWSDFVEHSGFQARIGLRGMFFVMGSPWLLHCPSHCPSTVPPLSLHCRSRWPFVPPNVAPTVAPVAPVAPGVPPTVAPTVAPTVPPLSLHCPSTVRPRLGLLTAFSPAKHAFSGIWLAASSNF